MNTTIKQGLMSNRVERLACTISRQLNYRRINTLDETEKGTQDIETPGAGDTSTSDKKEKTFTEAQVTKMVSDAKAASGREQKKLTDQIEEANKVSESLRQNAEITNGKLTALQRQIDEAELDKAKDDPQLLSLYQQKQNLQTRATDLEERERKVATSEAQLKADKEAIAAAKAEATIVKVAVKYHLNIEDLSDLGITDEEALEKVAAKIAGGKPKKKAGEEDKDAGDLTPDSGISSGGEHTPTMEERDKMSPEQYIAWRKKQEKTA